MAPQLSPLERLRQARQQRWLAERRQAIAIAMAQAVLKAVADLDRPAD